MNFVMIGQEKRDLLIQVTSWACLTVYIISANSENNDRNDNSKQFVSDIEL